MKIYNSFNEMFNANNIYIIKNSVDYLPGWKYDNSTGKQKRKRVPGYCICDNTTGTPLLDITPSINEGYLTVYTRFYWYPEFKWFDRSRVKSLFKTFCNTIHNNKVIFHDNGLSPDSAAIFIPIDTPKKELDYIVTELDKYLNKTLNELRPTEQIES